MNQATIFNQHDHQVCISRALSKAHQLCVSRKLRLTPIRKEVLRYIWESHKPTGAYELLAKINRQGRNAAPPAVYRTLNFLLAHGFIHRIASLNAYIGCVCPNDGHQGSFLICLGCQSAQEVNQPNLSSAIAQTASEEDFTVQSVTVEITGLCPTCRASA